MCTATTTEWQVRGGSFATGTIWRQVQHVRRDAESGSQHRALAATLRGVAGGCCARNLVERFFNKIEPCRRVATRYDKLAANYLAFIKLASIRIWLRSARCRAGSPTSGFAAARGGSPRLMASARRNWLSAIGPGMRPTTTGASENRTGASKSPVRHRA